MPQKKVQKQNAQPQEKENTGWILVALPKKAVIKRTETYLLFDVDGQASGIVSSKFIRNKESETHLFISMPCEYEVNCRVREKTEGRYVTTKEYIIKAKDLKALVKEYEKRCEVPQDQLPF